MSFHSVQLASDLLRAYHAGDSRSLHEVASAAEIKLKVVPAASSFDEEIRDLITGIAQALELQEDSQVSQREIPNTELEVCLKLLQHICSFRPATP